MADSFTLWSVGIKLANNEIKYVEKELLHRMVCIGCEKTTAEDACPDCGPDADLVEIELPTGDLWPGFEWEIDDDMLIMVSRGDYPIDNAADFTQEYLTRFGHDDIITMTCAYTCSSPRPGQFGGAGVAVSRWGQEWRTWDDLEVEKEKLLARRPVEMKLEDN